MRYLDEMLREEPDLRLVHTDDVAHKQIVGSVITALGRHPGDYAAFPQDNLVRLQQPRNLCPCLFTASRRAGNERRLRDVGAHRQAHAAQRLHALCNGIDANGLFPGVFVEEEMEFVKRRALHLPMVLLVQIAQRDRVGQELVQLLDAFAARGFRQADWERNEKVVWLDLGRMLISDRRGVSHVDVSVDGLRRHGVLPGTGGVAVTTRRRVAAMATRSTSSAPWATSCAPRATAPAMSSRTSRPFCVKSTFLPTRALASSTRLSPGHRRRGYG